MSSGYQTVFIKKLQTIVVEMSFPFDIQSNQYQAATFGTKKTWSYKIDDLLKEVQFL